MKYDVGANGYSDDCSSVWDHTGYQRGEYNVQDKWQKLYLDGKHVGSIRTTYDGIWEYHLKATRGHRFSLKPTPPPAKEE